jgi:V/A-type H+-transporting ATPase subunit F
MDPRATPEVGAATRGALAVALRPADALGFRLAGVRVEAIAPGEEPAKLRALLADGSVALVAVEREVHGAAPEALLRAVAARGRPVVLPFVLPRAGAAGGREYVAALLRRFIGYHVKLGAGGLP